MVLLWTCGAAGIGTMLYPRHTPFLGIYQSGKIVLLGRDVNHCQIFMVSPLLNYSKSSIIRVVIFHVECAVKQVQSAQIHANGPGVHRSGKVHCHRPVTCYIHDNLLVTAVIDCQVSCFETVT